MPARRPYCPSWAVCTTGTRTCSWFGSTGTRPMAIFTKYRLACRPGPEESWEECAHRELEEETGMRAATLTPLTRIYTTPGFTDEVIRLFVATDLEPGELSRDPDEFMEVVRVAFSEVLEMVRDGRIVDAKSIATILYADRFVRGDRGGHGPGEREDVSPR